MAKAKMSKEKCYTSVTAEQLNEAIKKKAQELFEKSGRKPGRDLDNWLEAEKIVRAQLCSDMRHIPC